MKYPNIYHMSNVSRGGGAVREFALQAEGWLCEPQPRHTLVVNTDNDSSTVKHSKLV